MQLGYARVSKTEQDTTLQTDALMRAGVGRVFSEHKRGAGVQRPQLDALLDQLRAGDVVVIYKLDRLARSLRDLLGIIDRIERAGATFRSLTEAIDTGTPAGRMMMQLLGAVAEFERGIIKERSGAGQRAAMERGVHCGRAALLTLPQARRARDDYRAGRATLTGLARLHGCHISSIKRAILRADSYNEKADHESQARTPTRQQDIDARSRDQNDRSRVARGADRRANRAARVGAGA
jgi:DNA invertase Pin-like site-specific DNA recombinase